MKLIVKTLILAATALCVALVDRSSLAADAAPSPTLGLRATNESIAVRFDAAAVRTAVPAAKTVALVRCRPNEYYPTTDFLTRFDGIGNDCDDDGYDVDRAYFDPAKTASFVERIVDFTDGETAPRNATSDAARNGEIAFDVPRFSTDRDAGWDKIFDKFYLIADPEVSPESDGFARGGTVVAGPTCVVDFPSKSVAPRIEQKSIKGLEVFDFDDAKELGVAHAESTVDLCRLLQNENCPTIDFEVGGKSFQFNANAVAYYDRFVKTATDAGMETTFVLVLWGHRRSLAPPGTIHPDFEVWLDAPWALSIAAPNLTTAEGVERWRALFEFLGDRYTRENGEFGRVSNFVVGNELNSGFIWDNRGRLPLDETVRQYERGLRIAATALRKYWANANVLAPFDNYWSADSATEFQQTQYVKKGGFPGKDYLTALAAQTRALGDFSWSVAYHPYGLDLRTPIYWDRHSVEKAPRNENAERLTPYNIEILPRFLERPELTFDGKRRDFYFTEQGFSSPHEDDYVDYNAATYRPEALPETWLNRQAAAFAYAHYKFVAIGAKANIFHRHFDVESEGLNIGLWTRKQGKETGPFARKPIWFLFQKIDGPESLDASAPYLRELTFYPETEPAESWDALIPNFDVVRKSLKTNAADNAEESR